MSTPAPATRLPADGTYLSPIDAQESLGRTLLGLVWQKFGGLLADPAQTVADLRQIPTAALEDRGSICSDLIWVADKYAPYRWDRMATGADDGDATILPIDVLPSLGGRWKKAPFADYPGRYQAHFLRFAEYIDPRIPLEAPPNMPSLLTICGGKTAALFLCPMGKDPMEQRDQQPGHLADDRFHYQFKAISKNWRGEPAARFGSPLAAEEQEEPGTAEILGRVEWFLRKYSDSLQDTMGVGVLQLGAVRPAQSFGPDLRLMDTLDLTVQATTEVYNEPQELYGVQRFIVQTQQRLDDGTLVNIDQPSMVGT